MKRNKNLQWYAFFQGFNSDKLAYINVLNESFAKEILKRAKSKCKYRKIDSYDTLKEQIKSYLMWKYHSKSEYEVIVSSWCGKEFEQKIDVWYQLEPNLDRIAEYVNKELNLNFEKGK